MRFSSNAILLGGSRGPYSPWSLKAAVGTKRLAKTEEAKGRDGFRGALGACFCAVFPCGTVTRLAGYPGPRTKRSGEGSVTLGSFCWVATNFSLLC